MNDSKSIYYLSGLDCADCARKLATEASDLPGVEKAEVLFAANKLVIEGEADLSQLKRLAKTHGIRVSDKKPDNINDTNSYQYYLPVIAGAITLLAGIIQSGLYSQVMLLLTILIGGGRTFYQAAQNILRLKFDMSVLMSIAVVGALFIGEWREGALVAWLFALSAWLESYTADKARKSLSSLMDKVPPLALVIKDGENIAIPVEQVAVGDLLLVQPGERIPLDGVVREGSSAVNQAAITGESVPVEKSAGDQVFGGAINEMGSLVVEVSHTANESTMAKIIRLVEEAQNKKSNSQTFIDRFATVYTPIVILLAALVVILPPLFFHAEWHKWIYYGLSLLVVACPCALVITTPVVLVAAMSNGAKNGVIIKGGAELEALGSIRQIALDKTGTLTYGVHSVKSVVSLNDQFSEDDILTLAAAVEANSAHPLAQSIVIEAGNRGLKLPKAKDFLMHNSNGVEAVIENKNKRVWVGKNRHKLNHEQKNIWEKWQHSGHTAIAVEINDHLAGLIALSDTVRKEAAAAVKELKNKGIEKVVMLTGDNHAVAQNIAEKTGITDWKADLLPQDKLEYIKELQEQAPTLMAGDGVNDAPALALADIGLAMGVAGSDTALEVADIALMTDDLTRIPYAIGLSRRAVRIIKQNIGFAIGLKLLVLLTIFPGWLSLWLAIIADMGANIIVTLNGMRLVKTQK